MKVQHAVMIIGFEYQANSRIPLNVETPAEMCGLDRELGIACGT